MNTTPLPLAAIIDGFAATVPDCSGHLFADLVLLARKHHRHAFQHRDVLISLLPLIAGSTVLQARLKNRYRPTAEKLTRLFSAYRARGAFKDSYRSMPSDELHEHLSISFLSHTISRTLLSALGLSSNRFIPEEHVTEWLYGVIAHRDTIVPRQMQAWLRPPAPLRFESNAIAA